MKNYAIQWNVFFSSVIIVQYRKQECIEHKFWVFLFLLICLLPFDYHHYWISNKTSIERDQFTFSVNWIKWIYFDFPKIFYVRAPQQYVAPSGVGTIKLTYTANQAQPQATIQYASTTPKVRNLMNSI